MMEKTKILVVDDDPAILRLCQRILERHGYEVNTATFAREALRLAEGTFYDLLITDIRMPVMDGFELASRFRQIHTEAAVILITGFGSVETSIQALRKGVDGLLVKPFESSKELIETVHHVLENRRYQIDSARLRVLRPLFDVMENIYSRVELEPLKQYLQDLSGDLLHAAETGVYKFEYSSKTWKLVFGCDLNLLVEPHQVDWDRIGSTSEDERLRIIQTEQLDDVILKNYLLQNDLDILLVPVFREKAKFILYFLRAKGAEKLSEADIEMAAIFSRQAVIAMENALLYKDLERMFEQAKESQRAILMAEKMSALGRLMGSLAHEMNNPLQAVRNCLHLSLREDITQGQRQEYLRLAVLEIERLSALAQNALSFYRTNHLERKRVDLLSVIELVKELIKPQLIANGIEVIQNFPSSPVEVEMIQDHIQQVILNVLLNSMEALKSLPPPRKIWLDLMDHQSDWVILCVEDNGKGIPPDLEEKVFEPFFSTRQGGTGLGLAVCYDLVVDIHKGDIRFVKPTYGTGARLQISLPR
ncbi:MAG: response regulator [Chloroflexota bacterium]